MTLPAWQGLAAREENSDIVVLASPTVTVTNQATGGQPNLFSDRDGNTALGNPFTANADGSIEFYVAPGRYNIEAASGGNTVTWENQLIGTPHGMDQPQDNDLKYYDNANNRWARLAMAASRVVGMLSGGSPKALTPQEIATVQVVTVAGNASSPEDDAYSADLGGDMSDGAVFRGRIANANGTTTPTFENTGGTPGALTITTRDGSVLWPGALSGDHWFQYEAGSSPESWLVLDPNPIDEDDMASDSDAAVPTQQSAKAYADSVAAFATKLLHVQDQKSSGTNGGDFNSGAWRTRDLNTVLTNEITGASLASNQITLPSGTYYIEHSSEARSVNNHQARLRDTTGGATLLTGTSSNSDSASSTQGTSDITGRFTLSVESVLEIQHQAQNSQANTGFGANSAFTVEHELYTDVRIWKVG